MVHSHRRIPVDQQDKEVQADSYVLHCMYIPPLLGFLLAQLFYFL